MIYYKYISLSARKNKSRVVDLVKSGSIWFADWKKFNDPMEGRFYIHCTQIDPNDIQVLDKKSDSVIQIKSNFSVLCCSKKWNNSLLWALYADGHKGLVVGFEIIPHAGVHYEYGDIEYVRKIPVIKIGDNDRLNAMAVLFKKGNEYKPEEEHRILRESVQGVNKIRIKTIHFGIRCSKLFVNRIKEIPLNGVDLFWVEQGIHYDLRENSI